MTVRMGDGRVIVSTGAKGELPAVFLRDAPEQGEVGEKCPAYDFSAPAPLSLTFPTREQAERVADALVNATAGNEANGTVWFFALVGIAMLVALAFDWLVFFVKFFMGAS